MKYLFINSVAGFGSTGRIVAEKCRELMFDGHECLIAYGRDKVNCDDIPTICIGKPFDYKLHGIRSRIFDDHGFGSKEATKRFLEQVRQYDPDVIWLHNIHGYYIHIGLLFDYLRTCGKKIYWTLHDCWAFTGHCAHFTYARCDQWKTGCHNCPQKKTYPASLVLDNSRNNYEVKKGLFTGIPNLTLITPSNWLAQLAGESFLREYPVQVVHNTINTDIFKPTPGAFRENHGLTGKIILLGVASTWDVKKGLEDFKKLASQLDDSFQIVLVGVSSEQAEGMPGNVICIPRTNSASQLAEIYSAADLFVNPTYEDNYPTVNLEARACGTRVICYDSCGCRETLGENDILIPTGDLDRLRQGILACTGGAK